VTGGEALTTLLAGGEGVALAAADEAPALSFGELAEAVDDLARRLRAAGVERGSRVALVLPHSVEALQSLLAIATLGAAAAPLNPAYTFQELAFYLSDLEPSLLLVPAGEQEAARRAAPPSTRIIDLVAREDGSIVLAADRGEISARVAYEPASPDDVALLLHTSGTTSRPKQVPLLGRNLMASARAIARHYGLTAADVSYCAMPLFHVHGLVASALGALASGGTVVVPRRLSPGRFWQHLSGHGVTWFSAGPTIHQMLLEKAPGDGEGRQMRFVRSCSSALSPALLERIEGRFGVPCLEAYGMTEASHQIASNPLPPGRRLAGSVGIPTGTEIRVVDEAGTPVPDGMAGEVTIRGPGVTPGYFGSPEANEAAFVGGWFRTGDLGLALDGYLRLVGRIKEMIIRGGENVSPLEVEAVLLGHPAVADAVCFGVPDEKYGEEVVAAVALAAEAEPEVLVDFCRERLAAFKAPKSVYVLDRIPRTPTGKLQRKRMPGHVGRA
jgi:acyl-CoA synthetase (AMP-forming)/AMP-acid ligase II